MMFSRLPSTPKLSAFSGFTGLASLWINSSMPFKRSTILRASA
jgi:hypothetical protein